MEIIDINQSGIERHADLMAEVFSQPPWDESWEPEESHERLLCYQNAPHFLGLSAIDEGEVIGFIFGNFEPWLKTYHFILKEMCVKTERQRSGVGKKLISELHAILHSRGVNIVVLLTRKDSPAERFYLSNGYKQSESMGLYTTDISSYY